MFWKLKQKVRWHPNCQLVKMEEPEQIVQNVKFDVLCSNVVTFLLLCNLVYFM